MSLIQKIKSAVELAGYQFFYDSGDGLDLLIDTADFSNSKCVVFAFLLSDSKLVDGVESASIGLFFSRITEFDYQALENDALQELCKIDAYKFLKSIDDGNILTYDNISLKRFYDDFSVNVTGVAVNTNFSETVGILLCQD